MRVRRSLLGAAVVWTFVGCSASDGKDRNDKELIGVAGQGELSRVTTLLAQGADVHARDNTGNTALLLTSGEGHSEVVQLLKEAGATD